MQIPSLRKGKRCKWSARKIVIKAARIAITKNNRLFLSARANLLTLYAWDLFTDLWYGSGAAEVYTRMFMRWRGTRQHLIVLAQVFTHESGLKYMPDISLSENTSNSPAHAYAYTFLDPNYFRFHAIK